MSSFGPTRRMLRRIPVGVAIATVLLSGASPAAAHGDDDEPANPNYRADITDAGADGLAWRVLDGDGSVELTNTTGAEIVVLGYQGEPYLRLTPDDGVHRNTNSPATYLNEDRYGDAVMPLGTSVTAEPTWQRVATGTTFAWHDHRAHWMSRTDPPQVVADPDREHLISTFTIPLVIDNGTTTRAVSAAGELRWLPDVAWWPPVLALTIVFLAIVSGVALATRPHGERWVPLARTVTGIVVVVVAANMIRTIADLSTVPSSSERAVVVITSLVASAAIVALGIRGWRGHPGGFAALAGAAMLVMLLFGSDTWADLSSPQLTTSLPDWLARWTVAANYTVVAPAFLAAALAGHWYARTQHDDPDTSSDVTAPSTTPVTAP